ncbi:MAG: YhcB family protein [Luminiphilus sp.]|nr:YhcB family protein [Luminiphilus sp.]
MPSVAILTATALLGLGIGLAAGWLLGMRRKSKRDVILDLEARLERAIESRADYEAEVAEHFAKTAQLLNRMTQDYREVYSHLASGADTLCDGEVNIPSAKTLLETSDDGQEVPGNLVDVVPPLDYAPRKSPDETGQLAETFGLDRPGSQAVDRLLEPERLDRSA